MPKKRTRYQNPEPFLPDETTSVTLKRTRAPKSHQQGEKLMSTGMSSKILKEAIIQQKEIQGEVEAQNSNNIVFTQEPSKAAQSDDEDVDDFNGFSESQSQYGGFEEENNVEDEKLLEALFLKDARPQSTLADIIVARIKEKDEQLSSEVRPMPKLDDSIIELYKGVGKLLNK